MQKQHIARHDAMMRMLIKEFTKGSKGSHYLIADLDVGIVDTFKKIRVHSKRVPESQVYAARCSHSTHNTRHCILQ